jgi:hypothetical protein
MQEALSPVYGEDKVMLRYRVCDLLWRPAGNKAIGFLAQRSSHGHASR